MVVKCIRTLIFGVAAAAFGMAAVAASTALFGMMA
jgi:hypothetical protein